MQRRIVQPVVKFSWPNSGPVYYTSKRVHVKGPAFLDAYTNVRFYVDLTTRHTRIPGTRYFPVHFVP
eukprot:1484377-Rhodomonas_salina.2